MSGTATPYGLRPVKHKGGTPYAGSTDMLAIASGYSTSIYKGDVVKLLSDGTIGKDTGTSTATPVGVFMGCSYTDPLLGFVQRAKWTASVVAADAVAYVVTDPDAVFAVQANGSLAQTVVGNNVALVQNAGNDLSGTSKVAVNGTPATTNTLPLRIIGFVNSGQSAVGDAFTDVLVIWNFGMHQYNTALGV